MARRLLYHLLTSLAFIIAVVIVAFPVSLSPGKLLLGHPNNDIWNHLWGFWWIKDTLWREGRFPFYTDLTNYPAGGDLYFIDTSNALLSIPFQLVFGLPFAYNLIQFLSLFMSAYGAYLLSIYLVKDRVIGLVAGIIYGFTPHILGQIDNGITETINTGWIPLFILFFLKTLEEKGRWNAVLSGLFLSLAAIFNFYYGIFCIFSGILLIFHYLVTNPKKVATPLFMRNLLLLSMIFILFLTPMIYIFYHSLTSTRAIVTRDLDFVYSSLIRHNITDLVAFFHPGRFYSPDLKELYGEDLVIIVYSGWIGMLLSILSILFVKKRMVRFWAISWIIFFILSLGPYLYVNGEYLEIGGKWIPLPFLLFFRSLPLFSRISHPFRFSIMVNLSMAIMVSFLLASLMREKGVLKVVSVAILSTLILLEYLFISPVRYPLSYSLYRVPEVYERFGRMEEEFAVLDLPICIPNLQRAVYSAYQTKSRKKIPYMLNTPTPDYLLENRFTAFLINAEMTYSSSLPLEMPYLDLLTGIEMMKADRFRYIVVHNYLYQEIQRRKVDSILTLLLGEGEAYPEDEIKVFRLE